MTYTPADSHRALGLLEALEFVRDAHFRDGLTVEEITTALAHTVDRADAMVGSLSRDGFSAAEVAETFERQATSPEEDPAWIDRLRPEFTEHASVEAIDAELDRARRQERRWHLRTEWLVGLRQSRTETMPGIERPAPQS